MILKGIFGRKGSKDPRKVQQPSKSSPVLHIENADLEDEAPFGIKELYSGDNPKVDVIFVHGLNGHWEKTWTAQNGVMWPRDLLPVKKPDIRVLTYGYDSRTHGHQVLTRQSLSTQGPSLITSLCLFRSDTKTQRRPIIFVVHSLGGIVLKSALIHSHLANVTHNERHKAIELSTYGIMYMGTPHQGVSGIPWATILVDAISIFYRTNTSNLRHLERDSEWLENDLRQYNAISSYFVTKYCFESYPTTIIGRQVKMIVPQASAVVPGHQDAESVEIRKDHINMVKFSNPKDDDFRKVSTLLSEMIDEAPEQIDSNWRGRDAELLLVPPRKRSSAASRSLTPSRHGSSLSRASTERSSLLVEEYHVGLKICQNANLLFTGREEELKFIHRHLVQNKPNVPGRAPKPIVIRGIGGLGKTQLARQYCYTYRSAYTSIFWIDAHSLESTNSSFMGIAKLLVEHYAQILTPSSLSSIYGEVAQRLGMIGLINPQGNIVQASPASVVESVKSWLTRERNKEWLLIYDNVDDLESFNITDFLPDTSLGGSIIITSRHTESARLGTELPLRLMEEEESVHLLLKAYGKEMQNTSSEDLEEAHLIVKKLGYLPLAIDQAGAYLRNHPKYWGRYLTLVDDQMKNVLSTRPKMGVWQYGKQTVFTTWEISFDAIKAENQAAAEVLLLWGFLSSEKIQTELLCRGLQTATPEDMEDRLSSITSFSLATRTTNKDEDAFTVHPLVHQWARERLPLDERREMAAKALSVVASSLSPSEIWTTGFRKSEHWVYERQIAPHIESTRGWALKLWAPTETYYQHAEHWIAFAHVYYYQGQYNKAEELYDGVVKERKDHCGDNHPDTLSAMQGLATVNRFQSKYHQAQALYETVLSGRENSCGVNHLDTLETVQSLAVVYRHLGRLKDSVELYRWALYGKEQDGTGIEGQRGRDHHSTIHVVLGLAIVYQHRGLYVEAAELYERVLSLRIAKLGQDHPDTLVGKQNLADVRGRQRKYEDSERLFGEVLIARKKHLGSQHPDTLRTIDSLGILYRNREQWDKAKESFDKALTGREKHLGIDHPDTLATVQNIAINFRLQNKLEEAEKWYRRAMEGRKRKLGEENPDTLKSVEGLALVRESQGQAQEARCLYKKVLDGFDKHLDPSSTDTVRALEANKRLLETLHEDGEAAVLFDRIEQAQVANQGRTRNLSTAIVA